MRLTRLNFGRIRCFILVGVSDAAVVVLLYYISNLVLLDY